MKPYCHAVLGALLLVGMTVPVKVHAQAGTVEDSTVPGARLCIIEGMGHDLSLVFVDQIVHCMLQNLARAGSAF